MEMAVRNIVYFACRSWVLYSQQRCLCNISIIYQCAPIAPITNGNKPAMSEGLDKALVVSFYPRAVDCVGTTSHLLVFTFNSELQNVRCQWLTPILYVVWSDLPADRCLKSNV